MKILLNEKVKKNRNFFAHVSEHFAYFGTTHFFAHLHVANVSSRTMKIWEYAPQNFSRFNNFPKKFELEIYEVSERMVKFWQ